MKRKGDEKNRGEQVVHIAAILCRFNVIALRAGNAKVCTQRLIFCELGCTVCGGSDALTDNVPSTVQSSTFHFHCKSLLPEPLQLPVSFIISLLRPYFFPSLSSCWNGSSILPPYRPSDDRIDSLRSFLPLYFALSLAVSFLLYFSRSEILRDRLATKTLRICQKRFNCSLLLFVDNCDQASSYKVTRKNRSQLFNKLNSLKIIELIWRLNGISGSENVV